jgi:hypothetical protein
MLELRQLSWPIDTLHPAAAGLLGVVLATEARSSHGLTIFLAGLSGGAGQYLASDCEAVTL